jgi:hypothetical protein
MCATAFFQACKGLDALHFLTDTGELPGVPREGATYSRAEGYEALGNCRPVPLEDDEDEQYLPRRSTDRPLRPTVGRGGRFYVTALCGSSRAEMCPGEIPQIDEREGSAHPRGRRRPEKHYNNNSRSPRA